MLSTITITTVVIGLVVVTGVFAILHMNNSISSNQIQAKTASVTKPTSITTTTIRTTTESLKSPSVSGQQVSTSRAITHTFNAVIISTTTLESSHNPSTVGQPVVFTATISPTSGSSTPIGTIRFSMDGMAVGNPITPSGGNALLSSATLAIGSHIITATYSEGSTNLGSSATIIQTVKQLTTTTSVTSSLNPSVSGQQGIFTATVSPNTATGQVTFTDTSTTPSTSLGIGSLSGGLATFSLPTLAVGSHQITATYSGDTIYAGSTSRAITHTVNAVIISTTTLESSHNPSTVGQPVTFIARIFPSTATGRVQFQIDSSNFGSPVTLSDGITISSDISTLAVGSHQITATYTSNSLYYADSTSNTITQGIANSKTNRIAVVLPSFTAAAYNNAFYLFYKKYNDVFSNVPVYSDLNELTATITDAPVGNVHYFDTMLGLEYKTQKLLPNYNTSNINDQDIHDGKIFDSNGNDAYDILIFGHEEYATQKMYDNLKKFVSLGGVIMFMDGNIFYAEVSYPENNKTVTLVKGHSWEYDGTLAKRSVIERWANETSSWIGSNYYDAYIHKLTNGTFLYQYENDPFDYGPVRGEDQYVTNPDVHIIFDYKLNDPKHKVVTYWKPYGNGRVIVLGIYSEKVMTKFAFLQFYDTLIVDYALKK